MAPQIAVLPPHVVDQIAAGEVIERPSSVVKELVDNAIDAGGRTITVETTTGGRGLVRVVDDGIGMSPKDAVLAFERHATSKLRQVDDLWTLTSMGFRGEALPSIASVSKLTLTTRRAEDLAATRVMFEGGRLLGVTEVGAPVGTSVEVVDLLYNLPARLKFLKSEATEAAHITDFIAKVAIAHPHLHLRLRHNGRTALDLAPDRDGRARVAALLGTRVAARMIPVHGEEDGVRVEAYLAAPELAQATPRGVQIFVGKRAVKDRGILHAITMGYGELVPRGRHPVAVVLLDVPPGAVDVNVHPQKVEVRFVDAPAVAAAVRHIVQAGVAGSAWRAEGGAGPVQMTAIASVAPPALPLDGVGASALAQRYVRQLQDRAQPTLGLDPVERRTSPSPSRTEDWVQTIREGSRAMRQAERTAERLAHRPQLSIPPDPPSLVAEGSEPVVAQRAEAAPSAAPGYFSRLRYLGQLDLTYLVCEADGELVLVDQHSAHERVELHALTTKSATRDVAIQKMLFPVTIAATPAQLELVERVAPTLAQVGFEAEPFGKATIAIKAVPAGIRHGDPAQLLRAMLDDWAEAGAPSEAERLSRLLAEIACHSVVRAGDRLDPAEVEPLLRRLDDVDLTAPAPHGRAVLLRFPLAEIGRRFGR